MSNGDRISKPKSQLTQTLTNWMTIVRGYRTTVSDVWGGRDASNLDKVASNAVLWGKETREVYTDRCMYSLKP